MSDLYQSATGNVTNRCSRLMPDEMRMWYVCGDRCRRDMSPDRSELNVWNCQSAARIRNYCH